MWERCEGNTAESVAVDNDTIGINKGKKVGEGLRYVREHSSLNFNGILALRENRR
jgi:hypothetical protein